MSGNSIGRLFTVTTFGESHGPALGCIVDGCPPGLPISRSGSAGRRGPSPHRHFAVREPAQGRRRGKDSFRRVRRQDHRHGHRHPHREHRRALARLREDQGSLPPRPCRLHLPAEIRLSRLSRRRPFVGARNRHARRGRRHRAQIPEHAARRQHQRIPEPDRLAHDRSGRSGGGLRQSLLLPGSRANCRSSKRSCGRSAAKAIRSARKSR